MLVYTGGGFGGSLPLIPSRNLNDDEVKQFGGEAYLLATGLYARAGAPTATPIAKPKTKGTIDLDDGVSADEKTLVGKTLRAAQTGKE